MARSSSLLVLPVQGVLVVLVEGMVPLYVPYSGARRQLWILMFLTLHLLAVSLVISR
jgi:hypothetical protein